MDKIFQLFTVFFGCLGFALVFNTPKNKLFTAAFGGVLAWSGYLIMQALGANDYISGFTGAVIASIYAEVMARVHHTPVTVYVIIGNVPLIPGAALYRCMSALVGQQYKAAASHGLYALVFAASMSTGMVVTSLAAKLLIPARETACEANACEAAVCEADAESKGQKQRKGK